MSWDEINKPISPESKEQAKQAKEEKRLAEVSLAQAYARCFATDDGKKVLAHLTNNFIINNDTPIDSPNITYEAGYHNGEKGIVNVIINQIRKAEVI